MQKPRKPTKPYMLGFPTRQKPLHSKPSIYINKLNLAFFLPLLPTTNTSERETKRHQKTKEEEEERKKREKSSRKKVFKKMGEVQVQIPQQQPPTELLQLRESVEPIDLSMLHLNAANSAAAAAGRCYHHHHHPNPPCTAACNGSCNGSFVSNSMKRRSPATSSGDGAGERSAKKLFCDQEDLALRGFSAVSLPMSLGAVAGGRPYCPVLRRCASDPYKSPSAMAAAGELPEGVASGGGNPGTPPPARGSGLPPLPPSLRRTVSDVTPSPAKVLSHSSSSEETTPDSSVVMDCYVKCMFLGIFFQTFFWVWNHRFFLFFFFFFNVWCGCRG